MGLAWPTCPVPVDVLQMRLSVLIPLAVELQIVCAWRQAFYFSFSYLYLLFHFFLFARFCVFPLFKLLYTSYSVTKCSPICHCISHFYFHAEIFCFILVSALCLGQQIEVHSYWANLISVKLNNYIWYTHGVWEYALEY